MRENLIRLCCVLLGSLLTMCIMLAGDWISERKEKADTILAEGLVEIPIETEEVTVATEAGDQTMTSTSCSSTVRHIWTS